MKFEQGHAVIAHRYRGDVLRSFHNTVEDASNVSQITIDMDPLRVGPAEVAYAENGNIRMWRSKPGNNSIIVMSDKIIRRIAVMTANNAHSHAYLVGAEALGLSELAERFSSIERQLQKLGYLSDELYADRRNAYEELMTNARSLMSAADFHQFYMAF